jgi:hypothetical protein
MLTQHRKSVCLSLMSFDLPVWSVIETEATLYQKDQERFHLLLTEPRIENFQTTGEPDSASCPLSFSQTPRLLWLEISPYRVIMTMQGNGRFSYRHFWEQGVCGISRYWLQTTSLRGNEQIRLRNFTRNLSVRGQALPDHLRVEYELWAGPVQLGHYVMNLEIHQ